MLTDCKASGLRVYPGVSIRRFGTCDMKIADRKAELPENIRGDLYIARFYMDDAYPGRGIISGKNRKLF